MLILSFESSAKSASVSICEDDKLISINTQINKLTHSRTLLQMAMNLLQTTETRLKDFDLLSVSSGPGSFTGLRIGISTVKGLSWACNINCLGVSTLEALAWNACVYENAMLCPCMDARRSQVYNALFTVKNSKPIRITKDRAISLSDLRCEVLNYNKPLIILGDGAELCYNFLRNDLNCAIVPENIRWQSAYGVSMASLGHSGYSADKLLPVYLRLSQAERERQERNLS
jgi:tRNA threonylcarbamoyladenosine biosynthesis protein TsaB